MKYINNYIINDLLIILLEDHRSRQGEKNAREGEDLFFETYKYYLSYWTPISGINLIRLDNLGERGWRIGHN